MRPAWSEAFAPERLGAVRPLALPSPITRDWAWGGSTGAGVKVAVVDSGVDASHPAVRHLEGSVGLEYAPDSAEGAIVVDDEGDLFGHGTA